MTGDARTACWAFCDHLQPHVASASAPAQGGTSGSFGVFPAENKLCRWKADTFCGFNSLNELTMRQLSVPCQAINMGVNAWRRRRGERDCLLVATPIH